MTELRAVLWDMDGTLLDSAEYHWLAWREALAAEGFDLTRAQFASTFGQRNDTILRTTFGPDFPPGELDRMASVKEARHRGASRRGPGPEQTPPRGFPPPPERASTWPGAAASSRRRPPPASRARA